MTSYTGNKKVVKERTWFGYFSGEQLAEDKSSKSKGTSVQPIQGLDITNDDDSLTWDSASSGKNIHAMDDHEHEKEDDEDVPISSIIDSLDDYTKKEQAKTITHATFMKLTLTSSAKADLAMYSVPVLSANMALCASMKIDATGDTRIILDLGNMIAIDKITPHPPLPNIISVKPNVGDGDDVTLDAFHQSNTEMEWTQLGRLLSSTTDRYSCYYHHHIDTNILPPSSHQSSSS